MSKENKSNGTQKDLRLIKIEKYNDQAENYSKESLYHALYAGGAVAATIFTLNTASSVSDFGVKIAIYLGSVLLAMGGAAAALRAGDDLIKKNKYESKIEDLEEEISFERSQEKNTEAKRKVLSVQSK